MNYSVSLAVVVLICLIVRMRTTFVVITSIMVLLLMAFPGAVIGVTTGVAAGIMRAMAGVAAGIMGAMAGVIGIIATVISAVKRQLTKVALLQVATLVRRTVGSQAY